MVRGEGGRGGLTSILQHDHRSMVPESRACLGDSHNLSSSHTHQMSVEIKRFTTNI